MDERLKHTLAMVLAAVIFIVCIALVVIGQRDIGLRGTLVMILGLAGLIGLLYSYNRKYK
ncbi:hypothetical protein [Ruminococcus sp. 5_1_39BFAA]|uniref:DUF6903 family protein n=1 Tax=Ruminococcus sp. 5_1_39BFAA TaxID=457412 RepID=UPI003563F7A5